MVVHEKEIINGEKIKQLICIINL
ncbi:MAG: hypothetical protein ACLSW8_04935 [Acutalibacteraceae bacterium]